MYGVSDTFGSAIQPKIFGGYSWRIKKSTTFNIGLSYLQYMIVNEKAFDNFTFPIPFMQFVFTKS